ARPLDRLLRLVQLDVVLGVRIARAARLQHAERPFGPLAAVHARRSEEDDGVLNFLLPEPAKWLEILGENADGPPLAAFEKLRIEIRERLRHPANLPPVLSFAFALPGELQIAKPHLDVSIVIAAPAGVVLRAFFDPDALGAWWQVAHAVTT